MDAIVTEPFEFDPETKELSKNGEYQTRTLARLSLVLDGRYTDKEQRTNGLREALISHRGYRYEMPEEVYYQTDVEGLDVTTEMREASKVSAEALAFQLECVAGLVTESEKKIKVLPLARGQTPSTKAKSVAIVECKQPKEAGDAPFFKIVDVGRHEAVRKSGDPRTDHNSGIIAMGKITQRSMGVLRDLYLDITKPFVERLLMSRSLSE